MYTTTSPTASTFCGLSSRIDADAREKSGEVGVSSESLAGVNLVRSSGRRGSDSSLKVGGIASAMLLPIFNMSKMMHGH